MKLRYFLRGLGTGILLTTLILCVSYRINEPKGDVVKEAEKLGMVFPEGTKPPQSDLNDILQESTPEPEKSTSEKKTEMVSGAGVTGTESEREKETPEATPKAKKAKEKTNKFTVRSGLLSTSVVREMKEAGIIKDEDAMNRYLEESGNARKVIAGTYRIPEDASYEEITKIITRQD